MVSAEFCGTAFGDKRRSDRLVRIGEALARDPGFSFPDAMALERLMEWATTFDSVAIASGSIKSVE